VGELLPTEQAITEGMVTSIIGTESVETSPRRRFAAQSLSGLVVVWARIGIFRRSELFPALPAAVLVSGRIGSRWLVPWVALFFIITATPTGALLG
jgi:hypothetical protein